MDLYTYIFIFIFILGGLALAIKAAFERDEQDIELTAIFTKEQMTKLIALKDCFNELEEVQQ